MFRFNDEEIEKYRDGFGVAQSGISGMKKFMMETFFLKRDKAVPVDSSFSRGAVKLTENNEGLTVGVALNYGGRAEILDAARRLVAGGVLPQDIDEKLFGGYLYTTGFPDVDLVIRTGGEIRTSNFLIWQTAYSEYYFTPVLWPDFSEEELDKALLTYSQRQRRFGGL